MVQMSRFDPLTYPDYHRLTRGEKLFLRTCCYYPPRPRRERKLEDVTDIDRYRSTYDRAFPSLWDMVPGKRILDVGCGEGGYALALAEAGAREVVGLDIDLNFQFAEMAAQHRGLKNVKFVQADITTIEDERFDIVISHDSFEHFEFPEVVLGEMARTTRSGGKLFIKFGPPWRSPWGRHMSGTIRRDRPWVHLFVSENTVMHCYSVYHHLEEMKHFYHQLPGGLNRMTLGRFKRILLQEEMIELENYVVQFHYGLSFLHWMPLALQEFFTSGVCARCRKL